MIRRWTVFTVQKPTRVFRASTLGHFWALILLARAAETLVPEYGLIHGYIMTLDAHYGVIGTMYSTTGSTYHSCTAT
jgi:hypothetical protein